MNKTSNYKKHTSNNPVQKYLIGNFKRELFICLNGLDINNVLDAGCGEGFVLSEFRKRNIGKQLEGLDYSEDALEIGNELFPYLTLKQGDIYSLPYEDNSFDLVICTEVLEHLERPEDVINEIRRVSKKYCLFSVPNEPFFKIANFIRGKNLSRWGNDEDHIQCWSSRDFRKTIEGSLKVTAFKKPFPWTIVLGEKAQ